MKVLLVIFLFACLMMPCFGDAQPESAPAPAATETESVTKTTPEATEATEAKKDAPAKAPAAKADAPAKNAATNKTATSAAQRKPAKSLRTEAELTGFTSETSDRLGGRISLVNTTKERQWWIKTGYNKTLSRTYGQTSTYETNIGRFNLDCEYRKKNENSYHFVSAIVNHRTRKPHSPSYYDSSGYQMMSAGYGRRVLRGTDLELAVAHIQQQRNETESRLAPVLTLRIATPVSSAISFDCDAHLVQPGSSDYLLDSSLNLTYKLTPALRLRMTYLLNNILGTAMTTRTPEWDKSLRLSLVFAN